MKPRPLSTGGRGTLLPRLNSQRHFQITIFESGIAMALIACEECGKSISDRAASCPHCGLPAAAARTVDRSDAIPTPAKTTDSPNKFVLADNPVTCPKCGSWQVHAEKRGWNIWTGLLMSSRIYITCLSCGHRFRPGEKQRTMGSDRLVWTIIIIGAIIWLLTRK